MADQNDNLTKPTDLNKELGASGTYIFSGWISGEEYATDLQGKHALEVFEVMRRSDPTVHAALIVCKNPIIGANWDVEPASDDPVDVDIAEYVKRELFNRKISWQDTLREALTCLDFGHYVAEIVDEITEWNGKPMIGIKKIASRKQRSIMRWETSQGTDGITQIIPAGGIVDIPRNKLIYVINEREGENYEGISLLRFAYKPWKIKDALQMMNAVALERMAIGVPVVQKGANNESISEPELANLRTALRQMRGNEESYLEIPASVTVTMLDMKAQSTKDVLPTINHSDTQITLSVLAQFLMLGSAAGGTGSRAVSADHSALFVKSLDAVARTVQQPFQNDVVNRLVDLNYSAVPNGYPKLVFSELSDDDIQLLAAAVSSLVTAGALTPDVGMENRLRQLVDVPVLPDDMADNYAELKKPVPPVIMQPGAPAEPAKGKDSNTPTKDDGNVDDNVDQDKNKTNSSILSDAKAVRRILVKHLEE